MNKKILSDLYYKHDTTILYDYKLEELQEFCKERKIKIKSNDKSVLIHRMKSYLERYKSIIANEIIEDKINELLTTSGNSKRFKADLNDERIIENKLLIDSFKEEVLQIIMNKYSDKLNELDKEWFK